MTGHRESGERKAREAGRNQITCWQLSFKHEQISTSESPFWKHSEDRIIDGANEKAMERKQSQENQVAPGPGV